MMISNDLFEICLVGVRTLVCSYINNRVLASGLGEQFIVFSSYSEVVYVILQEGLFIR